MMIMRMYLAGTSAALAAILLAPLGASADKLIRGDLQHGGQLFRLECASCHGPDGKGAPTWRKATSDKAELGELPNLSESAFLAQRSDQELRRAIRDGQGRDKRIVGHAFRNLSTLDAWDLVEWLRRDTFGVDDFFRGAASFTAKKFEIDRLGAERFEKVLKTSLSDAEREVVILTVYAGPRGEDDEARLVPWTPVELDLLEAKDRLGFLAYVDLQVPRSGEAVEIGLSLAPDGKVRQVKVRAADPARRATYEKILASFVGQGGKGAAAFTAPRGVADGAQWASAFGRAAGRVAEGVTMFEKAEIARTAFDR